MSSLRAEAAAWIASFRDGPLAAPAYERVFAVRPIFAEMVFTPVPDRQAADGSEEWVLVGWDSLPVEQPWPGQVRYVLTEITTVDGADARPIAYYTVPDY